MKKKVLTLTISKEWFDKIVLGVKTEEYREIKPYWVTRLYYDKFGKLSPSLVKELTNNLIKDGNVNSFEIENNGLQVYQVPFTHVLFINGYRKDSPRIEKEIVSITIGKPKRGLCPDKWLDTEFFVIKFK